MKDFTNYISFLRAVLQDVQENGKQMHRDHACVLRLVFVDHL